MSHIEPPNPRDLPSPASLRRRAMAVVIGAAALIIVGVLPAENGTDITGLGKVIGLKEMGDIKKMVAAEFVAESTFLADSRRADSITAAEESAAIQAVASGRPVARTDTTSVIVPPGGEATIRVRMSQGEWVVYSWSTNGGSVEDDIRGDSINAEPGWYHRYHSGSLRASASGAIVAKFDGWHGWLWRNASDSEVTVTVVTRGGYSEITGSR